MEVERSSSAGGTEAGQVQKDGVDVATTGAASADAIDEQTARRAPEHTLPGPVDSPAEPMIAPVAQVHEVEQGEDRSAADPEDASARPGTGQAEITRTEIPVAAPSREPEPGPDSLAASIWGAAPPVAPATPPAPPTPPPTQQLPAPPTPPRTPPPTQQPPAPPTPPPTQQPPAPPTQQPSAQPDRAGQAWDPDALAAALWSSTESPASPLVPDVGRPDEESGRHPAPTESEVPTATGPVPTWAFGSVPGYGEAGPAPAPTLGDLTLDPSALRPKVTVRSGGASLTIDETKLVLRQWLRKTELPWRSVRGFEARFEGAGSGGSGGSLIALTDHGPVELPGTHRSVVDLRYLQALLEAYRQRALGNA